MDFKPGERITVMVDSRPYDTYIDDAGTQRFHEDPEHPLWDRWNGDYKASGSGRGTEDLNQLAVAYRNGEFDQRTYMEFNMSLGYSVCGFLELSFFDDLELLNPIWDECDFLIVLE